MFYYAYFAPHRSCTKYTVNLETKRYDSEDIPIDTIELKEWHKVLITPNMDIVMKDYSFVAFWFAEHIRGDVLYEDDDKSDGFYHFRDPNDALLFKLKAS